MDANQWITAYAGRLQVEPPTEGEFSEILDLAAEAAHASERVAAPVACWLAARSGRPLAEVLAEAREVGGAAG